MVRQVLEFTNQGGKQLRTLANRLEQVVGDLSGHGEQDVGILAQFFGQGAGGFGGGTRLEASLDFAQVRGLDADSDGDLAEGVGVAELALFAEPAVPEKRAEGGFAHGV